MKKEEIELVEKWKPVLEYIGDEVPRIPSKDLLQHAKHLNYIEEFARRHDRSVRAITGLPMLLVTSYRRNLEEFTLSEDNIEWYDVKYSPRCGVSFEGNYLFLKVPNFPNNVLNKLHDNFYNSSLLKSINYPEGEYQDIYFPVLTSDFYQSVYPASTTRVDYKCVFTKEELDEMLVDKGELF